MGYDTNFRGRLTFSKELDSDQLKKLTEFISRDHKEPGIWTRHCDWRTDGKFLGWNGSEKSYDMEKWLQIIVDRYLRFWGIELTGRMLAKGERYNDVWTLEVKNWKVIKTMVDIPTDLGITE
jgi:hypothetical protein